MILNTILVIIVAIKLSNSQDLYPGSPCTTKDNSNGVCTAAHSCDWAKLQLDSKQITHQDLVQCGFEGTESIICCKSGYTTKRKSDTACDLVKNLKKGYSDLANHVTNGVPTQLGEYPHQAAIGYMDPIEKKLKYNCGGSLISSRFILTAAHCVNKKNERPASINLGRIVLESTRIEGEVDFNSNVKNVIIHPDYTSRKNYNDIALVELETPVPNFSKYLYPACLSTNPNDISSRSKFYVTGWGIYNARKREKSTVLLKGALDYIPESECNREFEELKDKRLENGILPSQICAFDKDGKDGSRTDACQGDSGKIFQNPLDSIKFNAINFF